MPFFTGLAEIIVVDNTPCWGGYVKTGIFNNHRWECKLVNTSAVGNLAISMKTNNAYSIHPSLFFSNGTSKKQDYIYTYVCRCQSRTIAVILIIRAEDWKSLRCPLMPSANRNYGPDTVECKAAVKENEVLHVDME